MSNSDTKWSADGQEIPDIEPHTKTKHLLIYFTMSQLEFFQKSEISE